MSAKRKRNETGDEADEIEDEMKSQISELRKKQDGIGNEVNKIKVDVSEMKKQLKLLHEKLDQAADQPFANYLSNNKETIIMGGEYDDETYDSVTIFNPANGTYAKLPPINYPRHDAASCVYNNDVIIAGGCDGKNALDTIEILKINHDLSRWTTAEGKLPSRLSSHVLIVYQEKLLVIGGYNANRREVSNEINELALAKPHTPTLLTTMPQPRFGHTAEVVNDNLFIFGGRATTSDDHNYDVLDSVMMYDFITKGFKTCPSLPKPVCHMATVTWGNKTIVIGGKDTNGEVLNDVIMYDTESGLSERLPSLRHHRCYHSAVIIDDVIFVFGGWNVEQEDLNSVESFTMGSNGWKELPQMEEERSYATAVVKP